MIIIHWQNLRQLILIISIKLAIIIIIIIINNLELFLRIINNNLLGFFLMWVQLAHSIGELLVWCSHVSELRQYFPQLCRACPFISASSTTPNCVNWNQRSLKKQHSPCGLAGLNCGALRSPQAGIRAVGWIKLR